MFSGPFTLAQAEAVGLTRTTLRRLVRTGAVRRVLRGVYLRAEVADSVEVRAAALGLVLPPEVVVVDRTAGWLHGLPLVAAAPYDVLGAGRQGRHFARRRPLAGDDVECRGPLRVTTLTRTALDLGRLLAPDRGLAVLDAALRRGAAPEELAAAQPRQAALPGARRLRRLVGLADPRADGPAESVLRLRWIDAQLPTPETGLLVQGVRVALALADQRFAVRIGGAVDVPGWTVVPLSRSRVLDSDAELVQRHLLREYHRHLLEQAC
jgi:hypothetical protein